MVYFEYAKYFDNYIQKKKIVLIKRNVTIITINPMWTIVLKLNRKIILLLRNMQNESMNLMT